MRIATANAGPFFTSPHRGEVAASSRRVRGLARGLSVGLPLSLALPPEGGGDWPERVVRMEL